MTGMALKIRRRPPAVQRQDRIAQLKSLGFEQLAEIAARAIHQSAVEADESQQVLRQTCPEHTASFDDVRARSYEQFPWLIPADFDTSNREVL